jgi:predicted CopG family antitoxin
MHEDLSMATKTITIDVAAYNRLKKAKRKDESFSQAIKRVVPEPFDVEAWLKKLESNPASDEFVQAVEEQIAGRRRSSRER